MTRPLLDSIHGPADVKALPVDQLATLAQEIRKTLAQYADLKDIIAMLGLDQLSP